MSVLSKNNLEAILADRLDRAFYSEDDFQHALGWEIHQCHPEIDVHLERNHLQTDGANEYIDICLVHDDTIVPIELKYKTAEAVVEIDNQDHILKDQGAQDASRKHFINDIHRIERFVSKHGNYGFALFLTNDPLYWKETNRKDVLDWEFRLHEGRELPKEPRWQERRDWMSNPLLRRIEFNRQYSLSWQEYELSPSPSETNDDEFRYLLLEIE